MKHQKMRKPYYGSQMFKWAENSRHNRSLTHKIFTLMLNRERLGIGQSEGAYVDRWLIKRYERMAKGEVR